jgi:hypothetical protein
MKTFNRSSLPEQIKYNGKVYKRIQRGITDGPKDLTGRKLIRVKVLSTKLKGKLDLHNRPYNPTTWIFINEL